MISPDKFIGLCMEYGRADSVFRDALVSRDFVSARDAVIKLHNICFSLYRVLNDHGVPRVDVKELFKCSGGDDNV